LDVDTNTTVAGYGSSSGCNAKKGIGLKFPISLPVYLHPLAHGLLNNPHKSLLRLQPQDVAVFFGQGVQSMCKSGWVLGSLIAVVFGIVGSLQFGWIGGPRSPADVQVSNSHQVDLFATQSGWRYQRGLPTHWKAYMINE
jgi:predicted outer membrane lipoprotein